jgi:hypothetical protein
MGGSVINKELEARINDIEKKLLDSQQNTQQSLDNLQQQFSDSNSNTQCSLDNLQKLFEQLLLSVSPTQASNLVPPILEGQNASSSGKDSELEPSSIADRAQIQFPTFNGSNFCDWRAKAEQFFDSENTPRDQRGEVVVAVDGGERVCLAVSLYYQFA